ncbi:hypothetical protein H920_07274 [Fukomys damarensis]|uniref:Uncharacterized protein n=1 Tax=Fukomys damarensis TaxID=885580 RepID=A0A091DGT3_FUKDA|nr:hypothetical protein H920_07274 [Fukomys damarensis]
MPIVPRACGVWPLGGAGRGERAVGLGCPLSAQKLPRKRSQRTGCEALKDAHGLRQRWQTSGKSQAALLGFVARMVFKAATDKHDPITPAVAQTGLTISAQVRGECERRCVREKRGKAGVRQEQLPGRRFALSASSRRENPLGSAGLSAPASCGALASVPLGKKQNKTK